MDDRRARQLVAAQRQRIEAALRNLDGEVRSESDLESQQEGEFDAGSELATEMVENALIANLRAELDAVARAEASSRTAGQRAIRGCWSAAPFMLASSLASARPTATRAAATDGFPSLLAISS